MREAKFSEGPWQWEHDNETASTISVFNFNGVEICRLQSETNAHLIAAAPEMYAALEQCIKALPIANETELQDEARLAAYEALAKARGE